MELLRHPRILSLRARASAAWRWVRHPTFVAMLAMIVILVLAPIAILGIVFAPGWLVDEGAPLTGQGQAAEERARKAAAEERINDARRTNAQIVGGLTVLVLGSMTLFQGWRRIEISDKGQYTDRYSRAIDQLGATTAEGVPRLELRLGAISTLRQVASQRPDEHYWPVMDVLAAYVRTRSLDAGGPDHDPGRFEPDVDAAITSIREDPPPESVRRLSGIDLSRAHLVGANLQGAHLERANLQGAHLRWANLLSAHLEGADLERANLRGANLREATLRGMDLEGAHLQLANLRGAHLQLANLREAYLAGACIERKWQPLIEGVGAKRAGRINWVRDEGTDKAAPKSAGSS